MNATTAPSVASGVTTTTRHRRVDDEPRRGRDGWLSTAWTVATPWNDAHDLAIDAPI